MKHTASQPRFFERDSSAQKGVRGSGGPAETPHPGNVELELEVTPRGALPGDRSYDRRALSFITRATVTLAY